MKSVDLVLEAVLRIMENISEEYSRRGDRYNTKKVGREMEQLESEFTEAQNRAQEYLDKTKTESARCKEIEFQPRPVSRDVHDQDPRERKRDLHKPHPHSTELRDYYEWPHTELLQEDLIPSQFTPVPMHFSGKGSAETPSVTIGRDMSTQLKRVAILVFSGNRRLERVGKQHSLPSLTKHPRGQNINSFSYGNACRDRP